MKVKISAEAYLSDYLIQPVAASNGWIPSETATPEQTQADAIAFLEEKINVFLGDIVRPVLISIETQTITDQMVALENQKVAIENGVNTLIHDSIAVVHEMIEVTPAA